MSEGSGLGGTGAGGTTGSTDEADGTVYTSGAERSRQEDGQAVGAADRAADARNSGADEGDAPGVDLDDNTYDPLDGDGAQATEDGQAVGAADVDADIERTS